MAAPQQGQKRSAGGGTSAARPRGRVLRIGVLLGGKIVEEKLVRERVAVTIGQSMKNTFSIPVEGLPLELTLFALNNNKYSLQFLSKMDGRLSDGGQVNTLEQLKATGATKHGDLWSVPLGDNSRGKLSLGDLTVLFQFVPEPPRQPKPMLPASVRGTFADRFDPRLSVILGASIIAHFAVVIIALITDPELPSSMADRAYNMVFQQDTLNVDVAKPPDKAAAADKGNDPAKKVDAPKIPAKKANPPKADIPKPDTGRKEVDQVKMTEDANMFANIVAGAGPDGKTEAGMDTRNTAADLKQQLDAVRDSGGRVAIGGPGEHGSRNGGVRVGTNNGPQVDGPSGPTSADGGKVAEKGPSGRINIASKQALDESSLSPDAVLAKIQSAYMAGLKRCYKQYLNKDGSARGKVTLSFSVNATGRAVNGSAHGFAGEVDTCIGGQMGSWRFPAPKDKDGEGTEAGFSITLQLVPD